MAKNSLATIYRPTEFEDVSSQNNIIKILEQQLKTNNIKNCYLFCGPSGCGKAQPLTSKIFTPNGYKLMKDIQIGDIIFDGTGFETRVLKVFPQGKRPIYKITFSDDSSIEVADNHLNQIYDIKTNKCKVLDTLELIKYINNHQVYVNTPIVHFNDKNDVIEDYYELGKIFAEFGIGIDDEYLYTSYNNRLALLQGIFDTIGCLNIKYYDLNKKLCLYKLTTQDESFKDDLELLIRSLGILVNIKTNIQNNSKVYTLNLYPNNTIKIFRKKSNFKKWYPRTRIPKRIIRSIEYIRDDECQCIYVESEDHTYLTDNLTVTHNTTIARILANKINKGQGYPIEIDAASNSGVDNVRNLIDSSNTKSINSEYKIYICDECHSFSNQAWQAFLKTLEEPNSKCIFMFCTTDVQKVPQTILNRVQRFDLTKIPYDKIYDRLVYICNKENYTFEPQALNYIVKLSKGRMRDAIASLEKVASLDTNIIMDNVINSLNTIDYKLMFDLINNIFDRQENVVLDIISYIDAKGVDLKVFINDFTSFILDINKYYVLRNFNNINIPNIYEKDLNYSLNIEEPNKFYLSILESLIKLKDQIKYESDIKTNLEICLLFLMKK